MASALFDSHAFVKRLTAAGMPAAVAEVLADEHARLQGSQLALRQDLAPLQVALEQLRDQLTIRLGVMLAAAVAIIAALVTLL